MKMPYYVTLPGSGTAPEFVKQVELNAVETIDADDVAYWILDGDTPSVSDAIHELRSLPDPRHYLRPIVCLTSTTTDPRRSPRGADNYIPLHLFTPERAEVLVSEMNIVNHWIEHLPESDNNADHNIAVRVLRFIASRDQETSPVMTAADPRGYIYPQLEPLFAKRDIGTIETLEYLNGQRLLQGRFFHQAHFCGHCSSAFLNYEEQCPDCQSTNLRIDELVHHFKCAYTGELPEFRVGDHLVCPKCELTLRHIGVDYDKPSIVYHCNDCAHVFQDPEVVSTCYNCGRSASPEDQADRIIRHYSITSLGQNAAVYGMDSLFSNILSTDVRLTSETVFKEFVALESARISRYKVSTSSLALVNIKELDEYYIRLGDRAKQVFHELSSVFKSILRTSDVITSINETVFLILMTETSAENAGRALERLEQGVTELLTANMNIKPAYTTRIEQLVPGMDVTALLESFLQGSKNADRSDL